MNIGNIIYKKLRTNCHNNIFIVMSDVNVRNHINYFNIKDIIYPNGSNPVSSIVLRELITPQNNIKLYKTISTHLCG